MKEWKCKQVIDFDTLTTTVKEERNKTLLHQMKLSSIKYLIWLHLRPIGSYSSDDPQEKNLKPASELNWTKKEQCLRWFVKLWKVTDSFVEQCM